MEAAETRGNHYVHLMRTTYRLANSKKSLPAISAHLLRVQFISLKDDALMFLAGIWTSAPTNSPRKQEEEYRVQQAALHHAAAFFIAHQSTENWIDFQTVLPLIIFTLESSDSGVREAAVECICILSKLNEAEKPLAIYGFDSIYGEDSGWCALLNLVRPTNFYHS